MAFPWFSAITGAYGDLNTSYLSRRLLCLNVLLLHTTGCRVDLLILFPGIEQQPGNGEDHLQGDIALAFVQHWQVTGDLRWLKDKGFAVIEVRVDVLLQQSPKYRRDFA